jgi:hypothetical protein
MLINGTYYGSRSAIDDRQDCPRMRFLGYDFDGQGYQSKATRVPLIGGTHEHELLANIVGHYGGLIEVPSGDPIAFFVARMREAYKEEILAAGVRDLNDVEVKFVMEEQLHLLEMMARGFVHYRLPHLLDTYEVVSVEKQWGWELGPGVVLPLRFDIVFRRKDDNLLYIGDYKGAPYVDDAWQRKHENSLQTMLYITALEEETGEMVGGIFYEGLVRGYWRKDTAKSSPFFGRQIQQSPYCYGYINRNTSEMLAEYTNRKGFEKFRVAEEMSVKSWMDFLIEKDILPGLFITMDPVAPPPELRDRIRNQAYQGEVRYLRDLELFNEMREKYGIDDPRVQEHLDLMAPQHTDRCFAYGADNRCSFSEAGLCLSPGAGLETIPQDPMFKQREPHHDLAKIIPLKSVA